MKFTFYRRNIVNRIVERRRIKEDRKVKSGTLRCNQCNGLHSQTINPLIQLLLHIVISFSVAMLQMRFKLHTIVQQRLWSLCAYIKRKKKREEEITACSISLIKGCKKFIWWCYLAQNRITFFFAILNWFI